MDSRAKGKRGELDACDALGRIGIDCRRSAQYCGKAGDADLTCDAEIHIEVKLSERLNPYKFIEQAVNDSRGSNRVPCVVMRSSYKPWLIMCRVDDLPRLAQEWANANSRLSTKPSQ